MKQHCLGESRYAFFMGYGGLKGTTGGSEGTHLRLQQYCIFAYLHNSGAFPMASKYVWCWGTIEKSQYHVTRKIIMPNHTSPLKIWWLEYNFCVHNSFWWNIIGTVSMVMQSKIAIQLLTLKGNWCSRVWLKVNSNSWFHNVPFILIINIGVSKKRLYDMRCWPTIFY